MTNIVRIQITIKEFILFEGDLEDDNVKIHILNRSSIYKCIVEKNYPSIEALTGNRKDRKDSKDEFELTVLYENGSKDSFTFPRNVFEYMVNIGSVKQKPSVFRNLGDKKQ